MLWSFYEYEVLFGRYSGINLIFFSKGNSGQNMSLLLVNTRKNLQFSEIIFLGTTSRLFMSKKVTRVFKCVIFVKKRWHTYSSVLILWKKMTHVFKCVIFVKKGDTRIQVCFFLWKKVTHVFKCVIFVKKGDTRVQAYYFLEKGDTRIQVCYL